MSAQTIAVLSHGAILSGGAFTPPDVDDVRYGVDNGDGDTGTLELPVVSNVRNGIQYGANGTEYTGTLVSSGGRLATSLQAVVPDLLTNEFAEAFTELQAAFNETMGGTQLVKIDGRNYEAIAEEATFDEIELAGGVGESGGFRVMLATALHPARPQKHGEIIVRGQVLEILEVVNTNSVTWTITAGDSATE